MMDPSQETPVKPTTTSSSPPHVSTSSRRKIGMLMVAIFMVAGVVGLWVSLGGNDKDKKDTTSPLRGGSSSSQCPTKVPLLNDLGMTTKTTSLDLSMSPPSCVNEQDPQQGVYWEWTAPSAGQVTLAAWTVGVTTECQCMTGTPSTMTVTAGQVLRVWTSALDEEQPLVFEASQDEKDTSCPTTVTMLEATGAVRHEDLKAAVATNSPPTCANAQNPLEGIYYDWRAPTTGHVTLAAWTVLMESSSSCTCRTTTSTVPVTAGQVYRVWTPIEQGQPLAYVESGTEEDSSPSTTTSCPTTVPLLSNNGMVAADFLQREDMTSYMTPPSCTSDQDPMEGVYWQWQAPADGQVTLAPWTVLVQPDTCDCITTVTTFDVMAGDIYRIWTLKEEMQPVEFIEDEE